MRRLPVLIAVLALLAPVNLPAAQDKQDAPGAELLEFLADFAEDDGYAWLDRAMAETDSREQGNNNEVKDDEDD